MLKLGRLNGTDVIFYIPDELAFYQEQVKDMVISIITCRYVYHELIKSIAVTITDKSTKELKDRCEWANQHIRNEWVLDEDGMLCVSDRIEQTKINLRWNGIAVCLLVKPHE